MSFKKFALSLSIGALALGMTFTGAGAQEVVPGTIEIHKAECYSGVGSAIFEECHDEVLEGVGFGMGFVGGEDILTDVTDEDGHLAAGFEGAGTVVIGEDEAVTDEYVGVYVYCRDLVADEVLWDGAASVDDGFSYIDIDVTDDMHVVCDWYNIAADGSHVPTDGPALPNTGAGVVAGGSAPFAAMIATGLVALAGAAALRRRVA